MTEYDWTRSEGRQPLPWFIPLLAVLWSGLALGNTAPAGSVGVASPAALHAAPTSRPDSKRVPKDGRIDINRASVDELCGLPGVGKKRAEAIVAYREKHRFSRPTQLLNIRGIGRKTLERMRPMVYVEAKKKPKATNRRPLDCGRTKKRASKKK